MAITDMPHDTVPEPSFTDALRRSVSRETAYPAVRDQWTPDNPFCGNCLVSSLLVWWRYGGALETGRVDQPDNNWHFRNRLANGARVDLTWGQYDSQRVFTAFKPGMPEYERDMRAALCGDTTLHDRLDRLIETMGRNGVFIDAAAEDIIHGAITQGDAIAARARHTKAAWGHPVPATA